MKFTTTTLGVLLAGALLVGCGDEPAAETATEAETAVEAETTTSLGTTTTAEPTTTSESTTTTEPPPTPGKAVVSGTPIVGLGSAVGSEAPTIAGHDYLTGEEVAWGGNGRPAAVLFAPLVDFCPHCSNHLEDIAAHTADNPIPTNADILLVTERESQAAAHPQDEWLAKRDWRLPTVLGSLDLSIPTAFSVESVPTWFLGRFQRRHRRTARRPSRVGRRCLRPDRGTRVADRATGSPTTINR